MTTKQAGLMLVVAIVSSCTTRKPIKKIERTADTVIIDRMVTDTLIQIKERTIEKPIYSKLYLDCDSTKSAGEIGSGNNKIIWRYDTIYKRYEVKANCAESISEKDSIINRLNKDLITYISRDKISAETTQKSVFNWWVVAFFCLFALNVLYLIRK